MAFLPISKALEGAGIKKDGHTYLLSEDVDANVFIAIGAEALQIQRVSRIDTATEIITITTHKGERFLFPPEQVIGIKFGGTETKRPGSAGFR